MVVRKGEIVHRSEEQQHYFNTPFQLSVPPPGHGGNVLSDSPDSADTLSFPVKDGDVILVATDGVFDNVPTNLLLDTLKEVALQHFHGSDDRNFMNMIFFSARVNEIK